MNWEGREFIGRTLVNFLSICMPICSALHASHLEEILKPIMECKNKAVVTITCYGGPDWSTKFTPNLIVEKSKDRCPRMTCYAPGQSRFNPTEHCWGPSSKGANRGDTAY